jgi:hypothetical protein
MTRLIWTHTFPERRLMFMGQKMDKLNLLDECIDGKVEKLHELLDVAFDHFDTFYKICKDQVGVNNIVTVSYNGMNDSCAKFDIICVDKSTDTSLLITDGMIVSGKIFVEKTPTGVSLNISVKED